MSGSIRELVTTTASAVDPAGSETSSDEEAAQATSRQCPTRSEGEPPLFQHRVTVSHCQSKQRGLYHKCFTCIHANGR